MSIDATIVTVIFACCATAHFVGLCVMGILARHRVQYLSLAWILAIFCAVTAIVAMFGDVVVAGRPGILNPYMLLMLVVGAYLQSIYSLGIVMPGFLQWGRMLKYASPVFVLAGVYIVAMFPAEQLTKVYSADELFSNMLSADLMLRLLAMLLGVYYVMNIIFLPRRLASRTNLPMSLIAYTAVLVLSVILYLYTALRYTPMLLCAYMLLFTIVNFFWVCHSMKTLILKVSHPDIALEAADDEDTGAEDVRNDDIQSEDKRRADFNEMNHKRYMRVQGWMLGHKEAWMNSSFTRDRLCAETGLNRQLLLQCLRSRGHNNVHEYIAAYRVAELKRLVLSGKVASVADCEIVGFGTVKTARYWFECMEGCSLDDFLQQKRRV